jgi:hypothetical protein
MKRVNLGLLGIWWKQQNITGKRMTYTDAP